MLTSVRYVGARMVQGDTCLRECNSWCLVGARLYALARVPTWHQKKKAASLI